MKEAIFITTVILEIMLGASLILSLALPTFRSWPPPKRKSWQYYFTWTFVDLSAVGIMILGVLDWNGFVFTHWLRFYIGGILILAGTAFALWGIYTLSVHTSLGLKGEFITSGPYKYSRNPQYVGDICIIIGYIIFTNSKLAAITGLLGVFWFLLAPFAEEAWLKDRFGEEFEEYLEKVPRFLGFGRQRNRHRGTS